MNANIMKAQIFLINQLYHKGHLRSYRVTFIYNNLNFLKYFFCFESDLIKALYELKVVHKSLFYVKNLAFVLMDNVCPCFILDKA